MINNLLKNEMGTILVSIILGLGLASMFRKVCKNGRCVIIKGPKLSDINKTTYQIDEDCYNYKPISTNCDN